MHNDPSSARSLKTHFPQLTDPRVGRARRHKLLDILMIAVYTMLCGAEGFTVMAEFGRCKVDWFKTWLALSPGIPLHDTFNQAFGLIDPTAFMNCSRAWTQSRRAGWRDGQVNCGVRREQKVAGWYCNYLRSLLSFQMRLPWVAPAAMLARGLPHSENPILQKSRLSLNLS